MTKREQSSPLPLKKRRRAHPTGDGDDASISVVIPTYNGKEHILACLASLVRQTRPPCEIRVVDDGSRDGTVKAIRERYPQVIVHALSPNQGFCAATNIGLSAARGTLVLLLNNDTEVAADCLDELARAAHAFPDYGFFAPKMLFWDRRATINSAGLFARPSGVSRDHGFNQPDGVSYATPLEVMGASGGAALYRRALLDDVGFFDHDLGAYAEDVDLSLRAQMRGWRCVYLPRAVVYHRLGASFGRASVRKVFYSSRNGLTVVLKNWPLGLMLRHAPLMVAFHGYQILYNARHGYGVPALAALAGKLHAIALLPSTLGKRRAIRRGYTVPAARFGELFDLPIMLAVPAVSTAKVAPPVGPTTTHREEVAS